MQLRAEQLEQHLAKASLAPLYVIHGDEPLLALEAADAVRAMARQRGYAEREVLVAERGFDWSEFAHAAASRSLFGDRKLIELRVPGGKPGADGAAALLAHCGRLDPEILTLVSLPRLDRAGQSSPWFAALAAAGLVVEVWPVDRARLPEWIGARLARQGQKASREVLEFLAERVEGNLLAAHQEVQKLALLAGAGALELETVQDAVASVARYDPNAAAEALVAGDLARYQRVLDGLRGEGEAPTYVLFPLAARAARAARRRRGQAARAPVRRAAPVQQAAAARGTGRGAAHHARPARCGDRASRARRPRRQGRRQGRGVGSAHCPRVKIGRWIKSLT